MPHRITNESARQMYGLDLMLKEYLSRKTLLFKWLGYLAFWKTKIYWNFKETMLSYIWQKKKCLLSTSTIIYSKLPIINEENKVAAMITWLHDSKFEQFSYHWRQVRRESWDRLNFNLLWAAKNSYFLVIEEIRKVQIVHIGIFFDRE